MHKINQKGKKWLSLDRRKGIERKMTLDTRLTWSVHVYRMRSKAAHSLGVLGTLVNQRSGISIRNGVRSSSSFLRRTTRALFGGPSPASLSGNFRYFKPNVFAMLPVHLGALMTVRLKRIWKIRSLPTTSDL
jgi:hypothetical protein